MRDYEPLRMLDRVEINGTIYSVAGRMIVKSEWLYTLLSEDENKNLVSIHDAKRTGHWNIVSEFNGPYCNCVVLPRFGAEPIRGKECKCNERDVVLTANQMKG